MKILQTLESYYPDPGGMAEVGRQLSERLVKLGHEVVVATTWRNRQPKINGVKIIEFKIKGNLATGIIGAPEEIKRYQDLLLLGSFDIIVNFAAQQWATDLALDILDDIPAKKVLVPTGFSALYSPQFHDYFDRMPLWMKKYDLNIFLSDNYRDINFAREQGINNFVVIPNGAAADEFLGSDTSDYRARFGILADHFLIVHIGSHSGLKGHREAIKIFAQAKIKKSTLVIIGNRPRGGCYLSCLLKTFFFNGNLLQRLRDKKTIKLLEVSHPEAMAILRAADLFLFPSNIECSPLVLFESLAAKVPFLASAAGNSEEIAATTGGGWILSGAPYRRPLIFRLKSLIKKSLDPNYGAVSVNIEKSAAMLTAISQDNESRRLMAKAGHQAFLENYTWEKIVKRYESEYLKLWSS